MQVKRLDEERRLLLTVMHDRVNLATCSEAAAAAAAAQPAISYRQQQSDGHVAPLSVHAALPVGGQSNLQRSVSDGTALPGSLRERFTGGMPAQHVAWLQLNVDTLQADVPRQEGSSADGLRHPAGSTHTGNLAAQPDSSLAAPPSTQVADASRQVSSSAATQQGLQHRASLPVASTNGWHLRAVIPNAVVTRRKTNMYAEQQAYWHKKEALCPTIKNCIQEVQQLRAQLSSDSASLTSDRTG